LGAAAELHLLRQSRVQALKKRPDLGVWLEVGLRLGHLDDDGRTVDAGGGHGGVGKSWRHLFPIDGMRVRGKAEEGEEMMRAEEKCVEAGAEPAGPEEATEPLLAEKGLTLFRPTLACKKGRR